MSKRHIIAKCMINVCVWILKFLDKLATNENITDITFSETHRIILKCLMQISSVISYTDKKVLKQLTAEY